MAMNHDRDLDMKARSIERNRTAPPAMEPGEKRKRDLRSMLMTIGVCIVIAVVLALIDRAIGLHPK